MLPKLEEHLQYMLPHGRRSGNYYQVGNVQGDPGDSLKVCLSGSRAGLWMDGATGEAGDVLDLYVASTGHTRLRDALPDLRKYLNIPEHTPAKRVRQEPAERVSMPDLAADADYLQAVRGIPGDTAIDFGSGETGDGWVVFPYFDLDGRLVWYKKVATQRGAGGKKKVTTSTGACPLLYGMAAPDNRKADREIVITEGEIDAMSYYSVGIPAVSVPYGAGNLWWIDTCWDFLQDFETIYLSFDMDAAGQEHIPHVIERLGAERCRVVELPKKDANKCLCSGEDLRACVESAKTRDPEDMVCATELVEGAWSVLCHGPREEQGLAPMGWENLGFRLRPGEGTALCGYSGHGKSNFLYQLTAWLAGKGERVFIGSYEESAKEIISVICNHAAGMQLSDYTMFSKVSAELLKNIFIHDSEEQVTIEKFFDYARYAVRRYGCSFCVLDCLSATNIDLDDKTQMSDFARAAREFFRSTGSHLIAVVHPRKALDEKFPPLKQDIKGSGTIGDLFFNVITVHKPAPEEYGRGCPDAIFVCSKQKVGGPPDSATNLNFDRESKRLYVDESELDEPYVDIKEIRDAKKQTPRY